MRVIPVAECATVMNLPVAVGGLQDAEVVVLPVIPPDKAGGTTTEGLTDER